MNIDYHLYPQNKQCMSCFNCVEITDIEENEYTKTYICLSKGKMGEDIERKHFEFPPICAPIQH